jgi:hypothetical protein
MSEANVVPQFERLPPELRREIWFSFLQDAQPLVYQLCLRYSERSRAQTGFSGRIPVYHYFPTSADQVVFELAAYTTQSSLAYVSTRYRPNLIHATQCARTTLAICKEARDVALTHLPHSLSFHKLPRGWTCAGAHQADAADGSDYPDYTLHFHGGRDIFIFDAFWKDQEAVSRICEMQGRVPNAFAHMTRIGIGVRNLWTGHAEHQPFGSNYGVSCEECDCSTVACEDACRFDPLPKFVACFPLRIPFTWRQSRVANATWIMRPGAKANVSRPPSASARLLKHFVDVAYLSGLPLKWRTLIDGLSSGTSGRIACRPTSWSKKRGSTGALNSRTTRRWETLTFGFYAGSIRIGSRSWTKTNRLHMCIYLSAAVREIQGTHLVPNQGAPVFM